jgi:hypothetical protein
MFRLPNAIFRGLHFPFHKLLQFLSAFRVGMDYCSFGAAICCGIPEQMTAPNEQYSTPTRNADKTGVAYEKESVTP